MLCILNSPFVHVLYIHTYYMNLLLAKFVSSVCLLNSQKKKKRQCEEATYFQLLLDLQQQKIAE